MGRGKRQAGDGGSAQAPWPELLVGDYVEITASPGAIVPLDGALVEVSSVAADGQSLGVIAGRLFTSLDWRHGDRWQKALPPEEGPVGVVGRFLRSAGAPSSGLPTAHSYRSRPAPEHPLVAETGSGTWDGWLQGEAGGEEAEALQGVVEAAWDVCFETDSSEGWEEGYAGDLDSLDPVKVRKAVELGELLCEADCMNDGFILHTYTPELELRLSSDEDRKGLEAVVELMEELGFRLKLEGEGEEDEAEDELETTSEAASASPAASPALSPAGSSLSEDERRRVLEGSLFHPTVESEMRAWAKNQARLVVAGGELRLVELHWPEPGLEDPEPALVEPDDDAFPAFVAALESLRGELSVPADGVILIGHDGRPFDPEADNTSWYSGR